MINIASSIFFVLLFAFLTPEVSMEASWDEWWTYEGISGVDFWGLLNPDWKLCKEGKRQSPVDINPSSLVFDPLLRPLYIDKNRVRGILQNNGHSIVFQLRDHVDHPVHGEISPGSSSSTSSSKLPSSSSSSSSPSHLSPASSFLHSSSVSSLHTPASLAQFINISGGPLSYSYSFDSIHLHFGRSDGLGSEHTISGLSFPAELQIMGFNTDLYKNMTEASKRPHGLVSISLLIQLGETTSDELKVLTAHISRIRFKGQHISVPSVSVHSLITDLNNFVTYEGSMTIPGCFETVTWIIVNKPLLISRHEMYSLRKMMQGDSELPKAPLGNNFRPIQPLNQRFLRTNIDFKRKMENQCPSMGVKRNYQVNTRHLNTVLVP